MLGHLLTKPEDLGLFGISVQIAVFCFGIFAFADKFFPSHTKAELTRRLQQKPATRWSRFVIGMSDLVFVGKTPSRLNRPRIWRVSCLSFASTVILFCVFLIASPAFRGALGEAYTQDGMEVWLVLISLFFVLNPAVDYLSVVETRLVLRWMDSRKCIVAILALGVLDFFLTTALILLLFPVLSLMVVQVYVGSVQPFDYLDLLKGFWGGFFLGGDQPLLGLYNYTTFATSVWIWLCVIGEVGFRLWPSFQAWFPIRQRPFLSVGVVAGVLLGTIYLATGLLNCFVREL